MAHRALAVLFVALLDATVMPAMSPARAAEFSVGRLSQMHFAVIVWRFFPTIPKRFSMIPDTCKPQTDEDRTFAPIGLVSTEDSLCRIQGNGAVTTLNLDMATAFLVSPCYVLTNYRVIFGNQKSEPAADRGLCRDVSGRRQEIPCGSHQAWPVLCPFIGRTGFYCGLIPMPSTHAWARTRISAGFG